MNQRRIDVCLAATLFQPEYSGAALRFQRYEPGLRKRGVDLRVFARTRRPIHPASNGPVHAASNGTGPKNGELLPADYVNGIPVRRIYTTSGNALRQEVTFSRALIRHVKPEPERPDLVQFLSLPLSMAPWLRTLRRQGIPLLLTQTMVGEASPSRWRRVLQRRIRRIPFQLMDCVVVSSGVMRDYLRTMGVTTRIEVIPNGVDLHRFKPAADPTGRDALREHQGHTPESELVLFVGPIIQRKGIDSLVQAWGLLAKKRPRARLVLVGPRHGEIGNLLPGGAEFQADIERILRDSGVGDRVVFTGPVDDVEQYFKTADVFVFPSRREGMGNVVLEAFACGVPSILTPYIGLPEEFGVPGTQYQLTDRSPGALSDAIDGLLDDSSRRRRLAQHARKWAAANLGIESTLDQYAALYKELADRV